MARWVNIRTETAPDGMAGSIEYDGDYVQYEVKQDEKPFLEQAKIDREMVTKENQLGAKKFATIPDIVAIEILEKYGIDLHDANTMSDRDKMNRFKYIIKTEYPYLLSY